MTTEVKWAVGITTVPSRLTTMFPRTMASICDAGFEVDRIFVDDCNDPTPYVPYGCEITTRYPCIRTHGNWCLSLYELYVRYPHAEHFAIFQDDVVMVRNLREYFERSEKPQNAYFNLYTFPSNQHLAGERQTWFTANQKGKGAVGLIFPNRGVELLLTHEHLFGRPKCAQRGWRAVDGGIVDTMRKQEWTEVCHNPSLTQHIGDVSSMGNGRHQKAPTFPGESFDALTLL